MIKKTIKKEISVTKKPVKKNISSKKKENVIKTTVKVKKVVEKPNVKKDKTNLKNHETNILEQSFELVKKLNSQVKKVESSKNQLKNDLSTLTKKVEIQEKDKNKQQNNIISFLKKELMEELEPIINKLNSKTKADYIFKEINSLLEIEVKKLKSEFSSKQTKDKKEVSKKLSDVEFRILEALKLNDNLRKEFKTFENKKTRELLIEIEKKTKEVFDNITKKINNILKISNSEIEDIKSNINSQKKSLNIFNNSLKSIKSTLDGLGKQDSLDLTSLVSKTTKLEDEISSLKSLLEKHEDAIYNRKKNESTEIENKVRKLLEKSQKTFQLLELAQKNLEKTLIEKVKEYLNNEANKVLKIELSKSQKNQEKTISENIESKFNDFKLKLDLELKESLSNFVDDKDKIEMNIQKIKNDFLINAKEYISHLDIELKTLKKENEHFEKSKKIHFEKVDEKIKTDLDNLELKINENNSNISKMFKNIESEKKRQTDYLVLKYNEIVDNFEKLKITNEGLISSARINFSRELDSKFTNLLKENKETLSSEIIANKDYMSRLSLENQEQKRLLSEEIENKLILSKEQYEQEFKNNLNQFNINLNEKEINFTNKLEIIEKEKNQTHKELVEFKEEISKLTKDYISHLDGELQKIKIEEVQFEDKKKEVLTEIYDLTKLKQLQLNEYSTGLQDELKSIIIEEKAQFERNENAFREIFGKKTRTLEIENKKRLDDIEKKFIDKGIKTIDDKLSEEIKVIDLLEERINAKADLIEKREDVFDVKEKEFEENISSELIFQKEKVENRLIDLEKQLNRRFLDLDSNFTTFKGVVVDEVEDLMKDVDNIIKTKLSAVDKNFAKLNFINTEATNKLAEIASQYKRFDNQYVDLRDEINDLRIKFEIVTPEGNSLNDHIQYMKTYEEQLIALISNLREKGVPNNQIQHALVQKGHPRFYVKMMIEDFDEIFN